MSPVAQRRHRTSSGAVPSVIGYLRVSTDEHAASGLGINAQREAIQRPATRPGWRLVAIHEDAASAKDMRRRPTLVAALDALATGAADALLVMKVDRVARSLTDYARIVDRAEREGWTLAALDTAGGSTPQGRAMRGMAAVFAELERDLTGQRTREALAAKRARGERLGAVRLVPNDVVERIRRERAAGASLPAIANGLTGDGVSTVRGGARWYPSTVLAVLRYGR